MASKSNPATGMRPGKPHLSPMPSAVPEAPTPQRRGLIEAWKRFWFTPTEAVGLHAVRVLSGFLFIFWLLPFAGQIDAFYGANGWLDAEGFREIFRLEETRAADPLSAPASPPIGWSLLFLFWNDSAALHAFYWSSIAVLFLFTLGLWTRLTTILTWLIVASFLPPNPALRYEADYLLVILALYLMVGYLLQGLWSRKLSVAERILGPADNFLLLAWLRRPDRRETPAPSYGANFALRLLQIHFAVIMVVSGLHKLQYGPYWGGVGLFYPLHSPFENTFESMRAKIGGLSTNLVLLSLAQYVWLAWQIAFPAFAWRKGWWRAVLVGGGVIGWLGSFFIYQAPLFGPFCLIGCLSYLTAAEWKAIGAWVADLVGDWLPRPATDRNVKAAVRT